MKSNSEEPVFVRMSADLRAERADRVAVVRTHTRQLVQQTIDRRRVGHDPAKRLRRHAEAVGYADAVDPRKLAQLRTLAPDERDPRPVHLAEPHHEAAHALTRSPSVPPSATILRSHT